MQRFMLPGPVLRSESCCFGRGKMALSCPSTSRTFESTETHTLPAGSHAQNSALCGGPKAILVQQPAGMGCRGIGTSVPVAVLRLHLEVTSLSLAHGRHSQIEPNFPQRGICIVESKLEPSRRRVACVQNLLGFMLL